MSARTENCFVFSHTTLRLGPGTGEEFIMTGDMPIFRGFRGKSHFLLTGTLCTGVSQSYTSFLPTLSKESVDNDVTRGK